ncbi:MAG: Rieske 2Fe-2S domain-containing protein, partial [Caldilineaceae bacterium]|nr:Rieske 2Fe-2S domain-containing protein [Caldilineaceae bacterium]
MASTMISRPEDIPMRAATAGHFVNVASLAQLKSAQCLTVHAGGHVLALFLHKDRVYAVDNRCPHMGFPLDKGSVHGGILT